MPRTTDLKKVGINVRAGVVLSFFIFLIAAIFVFLSGSNLAVMVGIWGGILVYPILQFIAVRRMHGVWRVFAFLPLILMVFVFAVTVVGVYQRASLAPIALILVSPLVLVYLVGLLVLHWFVVRGKSE